MIVAKNKQKSNKPKIFSTIQAKLHVERKAGAWAGKSKNF